MFCGSGHNTEVALRDKKPNQEKKNQPQCFSNRQDRRLIKLTQHERQLRLNHLIKTISKQQLKIIINLVEQQLKQILLRYERDILSPEISERARFQQIKHQHYRNWRQAIKEIQIINLIHNEQTCFKIIYSFKFQKQFQNFKVLKLINYKEKCYNLNTFQMLIEALYSERLDRLYYLKIKASKYLDGEVSGYPNEKRSLNISSAFKQSRLKQLIWFIDKQINQLEKQQAHMIPIRFQQHVDDAIQKVDLNINFFYVAAWISSFFLALKDESTCLDVQNIPGAVNTFRKWLLANAIITLTASITVVFAASFYKKQTKKHVHQKYFNSPNPSRCQTFLKCIYKIGEDISTYTVILIFLGKIAWILYGIVIFLQYLKFQENCSDNILNYCSIQFLAFFTLFVYYFITGLLKQIKQPSKCISKKVKQFKNWFSDKINWFREKINYTSGIVEESFDDSNEQIMQMNPENPRQPIRDPQRKVNIFSEKDDLSDVMQKVLLWSLIGWIYDLVLWKKDKSQCLDDEYEHNVLTYRQWIRIDGWWSLSIFISVLVFMILKACQQRKLTFWKQQNGMHHMQKNCSLGERVVLILFRFASIGKLFWIILGIVMLFFQFNPNDYSDKEKQTKQIKFRCSSNVTNYLILYFTEIVYIVFMTIVMLVQGRILNRIFDEKLAEKRYQRVLQTQIPQQELQINPSP